MRIFITLIFLNHLYFAVCQRVAPGVPPQHYQQPPPQQQQIYQQHVPVHQQQQQQIPIHQQQQIPMHQQVPVQHQVPQQQIPMQHQVPQQQIPVQHQQHGGHAPHQAMPGQILNAANIEHEKEHLGEHLNVKIDTSKMSEQELQFHYFKMHDADNNNKLDGCELIKSLIHWHEQGHKDPLNPSAEGQKVFGDEELVNLIDPIFDVDDTNRDGFIDYTEFIQAQSKSAAKPPS